MVEYQNKIITIRSEPRIPGKDYTPKTLRYDWNTIKTPKKKICMKNGETMIADSFRYSDKRGDHAWFFYDSKGQGGAYLKDILSIEPVYE